MDEILELVKKSKNGDKEAFGRLYDEFADRIFRYIKAKINSTQQAEDILQEVFLKAWANINQFELREQANFSAWLYRIATNAIYDYFRRMYRKPEALELNDEVDRPSGQNLQNEVADKLETEVVYKALEQLPGNYRSILELRFVQGFSVAEAAEILGKSNTASRILQFRALKAVRKILDNNNDLQHSKI